MDTVNFYIHNITSGMRTFSIEGRKNSPSVFIDESNNLVEISGNSTLKETNWFYSNVLRWILALNNSSIEKKTVNIRLKKVNNSSTKRLSFLILKLRQEYPSKNCEINWYEESNNTGGDILNDWISNRPELLMNII
jgi:hypothetical protein